MKTGRENKKSDLLSDSENEAVFQMLGPRGQSLQTAVVQLYITEEPKHDEWFKKDTGVLCLVKDHGYRSYFFRLYCLKMMEKVWEHEIYQNMFYTTLRQFLHSFEGEQYHVAFNFANSTEAMMMKCSIDSLLLRLNSDQKPPTQPQNILTIKEKSKKKKKKKKDKNRPKIDKDSIGRPCDFKHIQHVGFDTMTGMSANVVDPQFVEVLKKIGIDPTVMNKKKNRETIYNIVEQYGGPQAVLNTQEEYNKYNNLFASDKIPTLIPRVRMPQVSGNRSPMSSAPNSPKSTHRGPPPPPPTNRYHPLRQPPNQNKNNVLNLPPPPPSKLNATTPPPPPPPPMSPIAKSRNTIPSPLTLSKNGTQSRPPLSPKPNLNGSNTLSRQFSRENNDMVQQDKVVSHEEDGRTNLLADIRKGIKLNHVDVNKETKHQNRPLQSAPGESSSEAVQPVIDLASVIKAKLADIRPSMDSSDSESDWDDDNEDWD